MKLALFVPFLFLSLAGHCLTYTFGQGEDLKSIRTLYQTHYEKLERILRVDQTPIQAGDQLTLVEETTPSGHYYPASIKMSYHNQETLELIGNLLPEKSYCYIVEYYNSQSQKVSIVWNNKKDSTYFDFENYSYFTKIFTPYIKLEDFQNQFYSNSEKLKWLLFSKEQNFETGDKLTLVETAYSWGTQVIRFPLSIKVDFSDPKKKNLDLEGKILAPQKDKSYRYTIKYYDHEDTLYRTLYINRQQPEEIYYIEFNRTFDITFPLEGGLQEWSKHISAGYCLITNPTPHLGGPSSYFHSGIDFATDIGTTLRAPYQGILSGGYIKRDRHNDPMRMNTDLSYGRLADFQFNHAITFSSTQGLQTQSVLIRLAHLSGFPEQLAQTMINKRIQDKIEIGEISSSEEIQQRYDWYYAVLQSQDEQAIIDQLLEYDKFYYTHYGRGYNQQWISEIEVNQNSVIALSGNTGRTTGPHVHLEVVVNGRRVDPANFYQHYGN